MNPQPSHPTCGTASPPFSGGHKLPMFTLGNVVATPGALELLDRHGLNAASILQRHMCGDFGAVCADDRAANLAAIRDQTRILSAYQVGHDGKSEKLWVLTEADRSVTTLLLPSEY